MAWCDRPPPPLLLPAPPSTRRVTLVAVEMELAELELAAELQLWQRFERCFWAASGRQVRRVFLAAACCHRRRLTPSGTGQAQPATQALPQLLAAGAAELPADWKLPARLSATALPTLGHIEAVMRACAQAQYRFVDVQRRAAAKRAAVVAEDGARAAAKVAAKVVGRTPLGALTNSLPLKKKRKKPTSSVAARKQERKRRRRAHQCGPRCFCVACAART
eukprot:COSAG01_NODE_5855_length_3989_cov_164.077378_2_plen_220_part_00